MDKMGRLSLPDSIYNWIAEFLCDHSHRTRFKSVMSSFEPINASVIQGSAIGPAAYLVNASDLRPASSNNELEKFADCTYLLVVAAQESSRQLEMNNVETWASSNNLQLNRAKCQETLYALKTLRAHGMSDSTLHTVFKSVAEAKLTYAAPAWYGFCSSCDRERLASFLRKSIRFGFRPPSSPPLANICASLRSNFLNQFRQTVTMFCIASYLKRNLFHTISGSGPMTLS